MNLQLYKKNVSEKRDKSIKQIFSIRTILQNIIDHLFRLF